MHRDRHQRVLANLEKQRRRREEMAKMYLESGLG
jgi:hypothetical protein